MSQTKEMETTATISKPQTPEEIFNEGLNHYRESGNPQDSIRALELIRTAALQGLAAAQNYLGDYYYIRQDEEAAKWYRLAANQGDWRGERAVGYLYFEGFGCTQDYQQAANWWKRALPSITDESDQEELLGKLLEALGGGEIQRQARLRFSKKIHIS